VGGETVETTEKCYCLEMFRKTDPNAQGECLKMKCGRYRLEEKRKVDNSGKPLTLKEMLRRKKVNESREYAMNNHDCKS
jgi:hypothetical protein